MCQKTPLSFTGILTMDRLFVGSKSEGIYPVLHANNGQQFRLHYKGDISLYEKTLFRYNGKNVQVVGNVDNLRGYLRIVLPTGSLPLEVDMSHEVQDIDQQRTLDRTQSNPLEQCSDSNTKKTL